MTLEKFTETLALIIVEMRKAGITPANAKVAHFKGNGGFNYVRVSGDVDGVHTTLDICLD